MKKIFHIQTFGQSFVLIEKSSLSHYRESKTVENPATHR